MIERSWRREENFSLNLRDGFQPPHDVLWTTTLLIPFLVKATTRYNNVVVVYLSQVRRFICSRASLTFLLILKQAYICEGWVVETPKNPLHTKSKISLPSVCVSVSVCSSLMSNIILCGCYLLPPHKISSHVLWVDLKVIKIEYT